MGNQSQLSRLLARPELPYILSALCLSLLIKHGYDSSPAAYENAPSTYQLASQRSLQDVHEKCYQEQHVPLRIERCDGDCAGGSGVSNTQDEASDFNWSILTCEKTAGSASSASADTVLHGMAMEVIGSGKMF